MCLARAFVTGKVKHKVKSSAHKHEYKGRGSKRPMFQTWEDKKKEWHCIIPITNQRNNMCLARAIVTGKVKHKLKSSAHGHEYKRREE